MEDQRSRNRGIVPLKVTGAVKGRVVAVAGVGGAGGSIIESLVKECALGVVRLADFDQFSITNINRQVGASHHTLGQPKVKVLAEILRGIDPSLTIEEFDRGVQPDNLDEFLAGVHLVIDAVDFRAPAIHLALTRRARELGIPVIIGAEICYGARAVWFSPTGGMTFAEFFGLKDGDEQIKLPPLIMRLPPYVDLAAFRAVMKGDLEAPAIATGGAALAALAVPMVEAILSNVDIPAPAPRGYYVDTKSGSPAAGCIRHRKGAWWASLVRAVVRTKLGRNHPAME